MPTARDGASALCVKQDPDAVFVVGGTAGTCAELLCGDSSQTGQPWHWRTLLPMHESRFKPGMILLTDDGQIQRILVACGCRNTTEMLTIACTNTSDRGQWTLIAPLSKCFYETSLVWFNSRILAFGKCHLCLILSFRWRGDWTEVQFGGKR